MVKYSDLNNAQKEAVISEDDHLRIIAGAGSGKTRVLTMRIAYLIEQCGVWPSKILAITFTNKAAKEMKKRIQEMLEEKGTGAWISTIHSLCMRILSEDITHLGYPKNFTVVDADDQKVILKEAYKEFNIDKKDMAYGKILDYIANNKAADIDPERAYVLASGDFNETRKAKVYEYYCNRLKSVYGLDFDDLILWSIRLFKEYPDVLYKWSNRFHYILVDEFQDIDNQQYTLIKQLATVHDRVYVVGDPDQTIYTWRGADVNIIINFEKDFKNTKTITLNENYRSSNTILKGANSVIKNNRMRLEKELFSSRKDGELIQHKSLDSEDNEAYFVASEIEKLHRDGANYRDIAVLYRSNYLSRTIEKTFIENQIPYVIYGGIRFYERMEVKDILSYLRLIVKKDDLSFMRVINQPKRGIGQKTLDNILELAKEKNLSMYEVIAQGLYPKNKDTFNQFVRMVSKWEDMLKENDLERVLKAVLDDSGYRMYLEKENETERLENVKSLIDDIKDYEEAYPGSSLEDYLQMISLYTDKASEQEMDSVNLLTIHSAKGLEFDTVFVIGLSEGIFPSERTMAEGLKGLEEERRLAYVAYTRAKNNLYLTDNAGFSFVTQTSKMTSRFVDEIDSSCIVHLGVKKEVKPSGLFDEPIVRAHMRQDSGQRANIKIKKGDLVVHGVYKEGVVLSEKNGILEIAFSHPHGIKKILASHPSIKKKGTA